MSASYVIHNSAFEARCAGLVAFMRHWFDTLPTRASWLRMPSRSIDIWLFENNQFVEHWDELNLLEVFQQIGASPMTPGATR